MLLLVNNDEPGVIGSIGSLLGKSGINISRMQLGRERPGAKAISVVGVDAEVPSAVLIKLKELPHILSAKQIRL